jgi:hypothetical protein
MLPLPHKCPTGLSLRAVRRFIVRLLLHSFLLLSIAYLCNLIRTPFALFKRKAAIYHPESGMPCAPCWIVSNKKAGLRILSYACLPLCTGFVVICLCVYGCMCPNVQAARLYSPDGLSISIRPYVQAARTYAPDGLSLSLCLYLSYSRLIGCCFRRHPCFCISI